MLAFQRCSAPLNQMTVADCLEVLENDCDPESARLVALRLREIVVEPQEVIDDQRKEIRRLEDKLYAARSAVL